MSWDTVLLIDKLDKIIDYRGKTPKTSNSGIITLSAKSVKMGYIDYSKAYHISRDTYKKFMVRGLPQKGDILMTTEAPLGCIAKLDREDVAVAQRLLTLRTKESELNSSFLKYFLLSPKGQQELKSRASGTTVQGIKKSEFRKVKILYPSLKKQKRIAEILSAYDDLIENNLKRIKLLEQAAQNIYKEWFVNMRFPGHENTTIDQETGLPEGWEKINLYDFSEIQMGYSFKAKDFNNEMEGNPVIRIRDILSSWTKTYTKVTVSDRYLVSNGDILIGMDGIFHIGIWSGQENALLVQRVCRLRAKNENLQGYLLQALRHPIKFYEKTISGATVAHLGVKHLKEIFVSLPKGDIEDKLKLFNDFNSQIIKLNKQNQKLKVARDILLPRLMNQTIEV